MCGWLQIFMEHKKARTRRAFSTTGRGDRIRTCGLLVPNETRYLAALHPDNIDFIQKTTLGKRSQLFDGTHLVLVDARLFAIQLLDLVEA